MTKKISRWLSSMGATVGMGLLALTMGLGAVSTVNAADSLYIGDANDNSVKQYDASTGAFQGIFVKSQGGVHLPNGIIFDSAGNLLVSNQNANTGTSGEILQFDTTGKLLDQLVQNNDPNAPEAPQGIVLVNGSLFVADVISPPIKGNPNPPGTLRKYTSSGAFIGAFVPDSSFTDAFHPRGVVLGPDGLLYVSNVPNLPPPAGTGLGGNVLRFNPDTGAYLDAPISSPGGGGNLNRPDGLVFGPDGRLYVTSFRADSTDKDKILIYQVNPYPQGATLVDHIDLDTPGQARAFAQALLFGPGGYLFVPITNTGEVRRYNVNTKAYTTFVPAGGPLEAPWFLTFGTTQPGTLAYP
jgi:sugar lactone lactonase YvrE